jgi:hypothetical protein
MKRVRGYTDNHKSETLILTSNTNVSHATITNQDIIFFKPITGKENLQENSKHMQTNILAMKKNNAQ